LAGHKASGGWNAISGVVTCQMRLENRHGASGVATVLGVHTGVTPEALCVSRLRAVTGMPVKASKAIVMRRLRPRPVSIGTGCSRALRAKSRAPGSVGARKADLLRKPRAAMPSLPVPRLAPLAPMVGHAIRF
jgi:hypothetical protein